MPRPRHAACGGCGLLVAGGAHGPRGACGFRRRVRLQLNLPEPAHERSKRMQEIASWMLSATVSAKPDPSGLPGSNVVERLVNGIFFFTLMGCLGAILVGAVLWAAGSRGNNTHY